MKRIGVYYRMFHIGIVLMILLCVCLIVGNTEKKCGYYKDTSVVELTKGWYEIETKEEINLPSVSDTPKGEYRQISRILEQDTKNDEVICFRTDHTYVRAYADGELIYSFGNQEEIPFGKTPGSIWNIISIENLSAGTEITVAIMCPYDMYSGNYRMIVQGDKSDVLLYIFKDCFGLLIMTLIPLIVAIFMFLVQILYKKRFKSNVFFDVGVCFILIAIWSFTETHGWQFFFQNAYAIQMINFVSFSMVIASTAVCMRQMHFIENEKHFHALLIVDIAVPIGLVLLQIFGVADFFETLTVLHVMDGVNLFVFITDFVINLIKKERKSSNFVLAVIMYVTTISCFILDLMDFYVWDKFGNGFFSRLELLIIMMIAGSSAVNKGLSVYWENVEKAAYERMAYTDDMTGMRNRRAFDRDVTALESAGDVVTILYVDMNNLKSINDKTGHQKGDEAIGIVAKQLMVFQEQGDFCYRLGGDEFCVIASGRNATEMEEECMRINETLKSYNGRFIHPLAIAYGAWDYNEANGEKFSVVMQRADKRMYDMKYAMKQ